MSTRKPTPPASLRKPATLDHLRKKALFAYYMSFVTEQIDEPRPLPPTASAKERADYLKRRLEWEQAVEAATVEVKVQALPRRKFRELVDAHPPTDQQVEEAKQKDLPAPEYNEDTFAPALIAASVVEPEGFTLADAQMVWDEWEDGDARLFFSGCLASNTRFRVEFYQKKSEPSGG